MNKNLKQFWFFLLTVAFILSCNLAPGGTPQAVTQPPKAPVLFLAGENPDRHSEFVFSLYDPATGSIKSHNEDFSGANPFLFEALTMLTPQNGAQYIQYNPKTEEILIILPPPLPGPGDPPLLDINLVISKTSFDPDSKATLLYNTKLADDLYVKHVALNVETNTLFMDYSNSQETSDEIWGFDVATSQIKRIATVQVANLNKQLTDTSAFRVSQDGKRLDQLLLYGDPNGIEQTFSLMTVDLPSGAVNYKEITTSNDLSFFITALSADNKIVAYYTHPNENDPWLLWIKDLDSGTTSQVTLPEAVGNVQLHLSEDGNKLMVGLASGWMAYDIKTKTFQNVGIGYPLTWDPTGRYLAGDNETSFDYYDFQTQTLVTLPALGFGPNDFLFAIQWR